MSVESVDDFDPAVPVFGGAVSQTKLQQQQQHDNDRDEGEKLVPPPQTNVNGQNDTIKETNNENLGHGTTEANHSHETNGGDTSKVHINGQSEATPVESLPASSTTTTDHVNSTEESLPTSTESDSIEKANQNESHSLPSTEPPASISSSAVTEPEPTLSTPVESTKEHLSSTPTDAALPAEPTTADDTVTVVPEPPAVSEPETPEHKNKSPRGKGKSPVVSTPPIRQSARSKKSVPSSPVDDADKGASKDVVVATNNPIESSPINTRPKRQAATIAITPGKQTNSTSGKNLPDEVNEPMDQDINPSDNDDEVIEGKNTKKSPSPRRGTRASTNAGRKREASPSPPVIVAKKSKGSPRGKKSITSTDEPQMDVDQPASTATAVSSQTPPKTTRTSATRKTPTSTSTTPEASGDYARKLRPRK